MYSGKTVFAQLMDCLPWSTFSRLVTRYGGDYDVRTFPCVEQYRAMAFAQLTYRESLRDIETCLSAQTAKLYHMGFREPVRRSTLADANETRDWRIYAEFAHRLIAQARRLYLGESVGRFEGHRLCVGLNDHRFVPVIVPVGALPVSKAAVKMHTLLDLRGNIEFHPRIRRQDARCACARYEFCPKPGDLYHGPWVCRLRPFIRAASSRRLLRDRAKSNLNAHRVYSAAVDRTTGVIADQTITLDGHYTSKDYPMHLRKNAVQRSQNWKDAGVSYQPNSLTGIDDLRLKAAGD